jgi:hypothetical protein
MKTHIGGSLLPRRRFLAAMLVVVAFAVGPPWSACVRAETPQSSTPASPSNPSPSPNVVAWTFGGAQSAAADWTVERGRMITADGATRLQPDAVRRVTLLSPPALPDAVRAAETFVLGIEGTGLQRVRVQARRDARGGWITIADASGGALQETAEGYVVKRTPGARGASIERLRIELEFRTTNPRALTRIAAVPAP